MRVERLNSADKETELLEYRKVTLTFKGSESRNNNVDNIRLNPKYCIQSVISSEQNRSTTRPLEGRTYKCREVVSPKL